MTNIWFLLYLQPLNQTLRSREWRKWSPTKEVLDCKTNSPCQHLKKCIENSEENMHINDRVKGLLNLYALTCLRLYIDSYYSVLLRQNYLTSTDVLIPFLELFRPTKMARGLNLSQLWRVRTKSIRNPKNEHKYHKLQPASIWFLRNISPCNVLCK